MKKFDKVVWGMVGCGAVTEKKSGPGLYKSENSELRAVFDLDYDRACDYAKRHGVPVVYKTVEEMLADPSSVDIHIEIDNTTSKLIAIATGAAEVKAMDLLKECTEEEAKELAAKDMNVDIKDVNLKDKTNNFYVFDAEIKGKELIRILDKKGFIKVQRNNGTVVKVKAKQYQEVVKNIYEYLTVYKADSVLRTDFYLCVGPRIMDFDSGTELKQNLMLMDLIVQDAQEDDDILVIGVKNEI